MEVGWLCVGTSGGGCLTGLGRPVGPAAEGRRMLQRGAGLLRVLSRPPTGGHLPLRDQGWGNAKLCEVRDDVRAERERVGDDVKPGPDEIQRLGERAETWAHAWA